MTFLERLDPRKIPLSIYPEDHISVFRDRILQYILLGACVFGLITLATNLSTPISRGLWSVVIAYSVAYLLMVMITLLRSLSLPVRTSFFLLVLYLLSLSSLFDAGLSGAGRIFLLTFVVFAAILLGPRQGWYAGIASVLTLVIFGWLMSSNIIPQPPVSVMANSISFEQWISETTDFLLLCVAATSSIIVLTSGLQSTLKDQVSLSSLLTKERNALEQNVQDRVAEIQQRAAQLETASQIARDISKLSNLDDLLSNSVNLIRDRFGFYHAGIFLLDEKNEFAVLKSATGEAGRAMIEANHRLRVGEVGIVGNVVAQGKPRISEDVGEDPVHFKNPNLPLTRSEVALPLIASDQIIGALDVQSEKANAFDQENVKILQTITDQLAVAVEKARLVEKLQLSVNELESSYQSYTQKSWRAHLKATHRNYSYRYQQSKIDEATIDSPETIQALDSQKLIISSSTSQADKEKEFIVVALPIKLRNQVLGVVDVRFEGKSIPNDVVPMLETITERLALALENARLVEEIQNRAERERMIGDISAKIRSSADVDKVLRIAAEELGRSLGIPEVLVQLRTASNQAVNGRVEV
jgi:GAF domain-containing protein